MASACHLCEHAKALLAATTGGESRRVREVDIAADDLLRARYGLRIPVLARTDSGAELDWPFDREAIAAFLEEASR